MLHLFKRTTSFTVPATYIAESSFSVIPVKETDFSFVSKLSSSVLNGKISLLYFHLVVVGFCYCFVCLF